MKLFFDWLHMGGYSFYVWSAYGLVAVVLVANIVLIKRHKLSTELKLKRWFKE